MMKIIVKSEAYTYMYDSTVYDNEDGQYFPSVDEAAEAAPRLSGDGAGGPRLQRFADEL